jgi:hypothetical protein
LHFRVLEFSQTILEPLEVPHHLGVGGRVVQRGEELQRVTQFLAPFAQVVQGFGGRVGGDRRAAPRHLGEGHPGALSGEQAGGPLCGFFELSRTSPAGSGGRRVFLLNFG